MLGITLALMLSALDQTVIGNVLPSVTADLGGFSMYSWAATGYMLASMVTIPLFGRLGDLFGRKYFVLGAIVIFTLASLWCASAADMFTFVVARALQGIGGGMLIGSGLACVPELFPDTEQRLKWQILLNLVFTVANAVGPVAGGWLTESYGWRYVFYVNIPLGILAGVMVGMYLPYMRPLQVAKRSIDWLGALLLTLLLVSLQLGVEQIDRAWPYACVLALVCVVVGFLFVRVESRAREPLLAPVLFVDRELRILFILATLAGAIMFILLFYIPLLFQGGFGFTPAFAGLLMLPFAVSSSLGSIVSSRLLVRLHNPQILPRVGFVLLAAAVLMLTFTDQSSTPWQLMLLTGLGGLGLGFILLNLTIFTQAVAEHQYLGVATALQKSLRLVGGLLGTAVIGTLINVMYAYQLSSLFGQHHLTALITQYADPIVLVGGVVDASESQAAAMKLARQALEQSISTGLMVVFVFCVLAGWLVFKLVPIDIRRDHRGGAAVATQNSGSSVNSSDV